MSVYYKPDKEWPGWRLRLESAPDEAYIVLAEEQVPAGLEEYLAVQQRETKVSLRLSESDCVWLRDRLDQILREEWGHLTQDDYNGLGEPRTTDYCARCGESPDSASHVMQGGCEYQDPRSSHG